MNRQCEECGKHYDDADRSTICPHNLIMPAEDLAQKKLGIAIFGKRVRFAHMPDDTQGRRVISMGWNGMVTLEGMSGEFAPHLFVVVGD